MQNNICKNYLIIKCYTNIVPIQYLSSLMWIALIEITQIFKELIKYSNIEFPFWRCKFENKNKNYNIFLW